MRKAILILVTLIALRLGHSSAILRIQAKYFGLQAKFNSTGDSKKSADQFPAANVFSKELIKPGSGAWSKQFDTGQGILYYQFKCDFYDPTQPDGTSWKGDVTHPVIQFLS